MSHDVDSVAFFEALARTMAANADRYAVLGDLDLDLGILMTRRDGDPFAVRLRFAGVASVSVAPMTAAEMRDAECWLEGPIEAWRAMFADIVEHGAATGPHTINALTLLGEEIALHGHDPMGVDKFSRFNQSIQEFLDGAAALTPADAAR